MATPHQVDPGATRHDDGSEAARPASGAVGPQPAAATTSRVTRWARHSLWFVGAGIVASVVIGLELSAKAGSYTLAALLAVGAVLRETMRAPGPEALAVRSRWLDVTLLGALAAALATLTYVLPST